jgi:hypothetical protein
MALLPLRAIALLAEIALAITAFGTIAVAWGAWSGRIPPSEVEKVLRTVGDHALAILHTQGIY